MKVAVFSTKSYDREFLVGANKSFGHELVFFDVHLNQETCSFSVRIRSSLYFCK